MTLEQLKHHLILFNYCSFFQLVDQVLPATQCEMVANTKVMEFNYFELDQLNIFLIRFATDECSAEER